MTKSEAAAKFRSDLRNAIADAKWNGLSEKEIATILAGESIR